MRSTIACVLSIVLLTNCNTKDATSKNTTDSSYYKLTDEQKRMPQNAIAGLDVADGLEVQLFASEPMIGNPTNIDIDTKGRVWMCEAYNYRPKMNPDNPQRDQGDRILILEDTNGDGKADTAKVFYQGAELNAPLGIAVLGNKVFVSNSPNVFVFTDTDGDDKADKKELLFSHVGGEQHDHAVHSFSAGPDGKLYFNFGNEGKQLFDRNGKPLKDKWGVEINNSGKPFRQGMVFRMNPDGSDIEVVAHNFRNNYEAAVDSYGSIWQSDNDDDGNQSTRINYILEYGNYGYTDEMSGAGWRASRTNMEADIPQKHWHQNDPGSIPNLLVTGAGSPAGMIVYEGNLLPKDYQNVMIHADAGPNIVRAYPVAKAGAGFTATIKPMLEGKRDQWFRPIDVCAAPDGSLFVADWYDPGVGGHQMGDMAKGRIYRIAPQKGSYKVPQINLSTPEGAVEALQSANGATRYAAWQALNQWGAQAEGVLKKLWTSNNPRFRARALWLLANIDGKENQYIQEAIKDKNPDIRITGIRAARQVQKNIIPVLKQVMNDADPQVRREAAIALHNNTSPEAAEVWAQLAKQYDGKDRWYLEALGIGAANQWDAFFTAWKGAAGSQLNSAAGKDIVWRARTGEALPLLAGYITNNATSSADRQKYFRAFDFVNDPSKDKVLIGLLDYSGPKKDEVILTAFNHINPSSLSGSAKVKNTLMQSLESIKGTQEFVDLVRRYKLKEKNDDLLQIVLTYPDSTIGVQAANLLIGNDGANKLKSIISGGDEKAAMATIKALGRAGSRESMNLLQTIMKDKSIDMARRKNAVMVLGTGWMESEYLLGLIEGGNMPKDLTPTAAVALSGSIRKDIRQKAAQYADNKTAEGSSNLPPVSKLAKQTGNVTNGKQIFLRSCAVCHKVGADGANYGPALSQIGSKLPKEGIYTAIIHPDEGISFGYEGYVFKLKDGSQAAGIIASETETDIELMNPGGIKKRYAKSDIKSRTQMENSIMPSNLHQTMTEQELIDLVEYLYAQKKDKGDKIASK